MSPTADPLGPIRTQDIQTRMRQRSPTPAYQPMP
jgi:hypothetical protein